MTAEQNHPESLSQSASRDNVTIDSHCAQQWKHSFHFNLYKLFMAPQKEDIVATFSVWVLSDNSHSLHVNTRREISLILQKEKTFFWWYGCMLCKCGLRRKKPPVKHTCNGLAAVQPPKLFSMQDNALWWWWYQIAGIPPPCSHQPFPFLSCMLPGTRTELQIDGKG